MLRALGWLSTRIYSKLIFIGVVLVIVCLGYLVTQSNSTGELSRKPLPITGKRKPEPPARPNKDESISRNASVRTISDVRRWANVKSYDPRWSKRARAAIDKLHTYFQHRNDEKLWESRLVLLDVGSGPYLPSKEFLPPTAKYIPCDLVRRGDSGCVLDLNLKEGQKGVPNLEGDTPVSLAEVRQKYGKSVHAISMLGVMEYVVDVPNLFSELRLFNVPLVLSYSNIDLPQFSNFTKRRRFGWQNHLNTSMMWRTFREAHFSCWPDCLPFINVLFPD
mmetsp:Transcript_43043/g.71662  ORF Transcript_43043/g.71662 Transcript_43043/m.71662 type:complete len:277 (-) Transcript_43043:873-1703(-)